MATRAQREEQVRDAWLILRPLLIISLAAAWVTGVVKAATGSLIWRRLGNGAELIVTERSTVERAGNAQAVAFTGEPPQG